MKIYKLQDPDKKGLMRISLVEDPAIQTSLMAFSEEKETLMQFIDEEQQIIYAPALIPNKLIFRKNINGEPAQVFFDAETIKQLHIDGCRNGYDSKININHEDENQLGVFCFENWLVEDEKIDKAFKLGFEVPNGTLMKGYKIDNKEIWRKVKNKEITGLSIEAYLSPTENEKINLKKENMNKKGLIALAIEKFKEAFKFADAKEFASGFFGNSLELGSIISDKDGNPIVSGSFTFEDKVYETDEMGAISSIEDVKTDTGESDKDAKILALETEITDLKAKLSDLEATKMANEETEMKLKSDFEESKNEIVKLKSELIEAKKVQAIKLEAEIPYEKMTDVQKVRYNRGLL